MDQAAGAIRATKRGGRQPCALGAAKVHQAASAIPQNFNFAIERSAWFLPPRWGGYEGFELAFSPEKSTTVRWDPDYGLNVY